MLALPLIGCSTGKTGSVPPQGSIVELSLETGVQVNGHRKSSSGRDGLVVYHVVMWASERSMLLTTCHLLQAGKAGLRVTRVGDLILSLTSPWESGPCTNPGQHNRADLVNSGARNTHGRCAIWWNGRGSDDLSAHLPLMACGGWESWTQFPILPLPHPSSHPLLRGITSLLGCPQSLAYQIKAGQNPSPMYQG